jgi:hypothetical protein
LPASQSIGDNISILVPLDAPHAHVPDLVPRLHERDVLTARGALCAGDFGIAEEQLAIDERRLLRQRRRGEPEGGNENFSVRVSLECFSEFGLWRVLSQPGKGKWRVE